MTYSIQD